jgi:hypothetical protein
MDVHRNTGRQVFAHLHKTLTLIKNEKHKKKMKNGNVLLLFFIFGSFLLLFTLYYLLHGGASDELSPQKLQPKETRDKQLIPNLNKPVAVIPEIPIVPPKKVIQQKPKTSNEFAAGKIPTVRIASASKCRSLNVCSSETEERLNRPLLSDSDFKWCTDQLNPQIGGVVVGKSWGRLKSHAEKTRFENLNCNAVNAGLNPSCSDAWGDAHIYNWRKNLVFNQSCPSKSSKHSNNIPSVQCYRNEINDMYCVFQNSQIDFAKFKKVPNPLSTSHVPKREFKKDFLTLSCPNNQFEIPDFKLTHLFSTVPTHYEPEKCDEIIPGVTLTYSHDNIKNLGHTVQDFMNVWLLLWLEGNAEQVSHMNFLTIDSMKQYHDFDDTVNAFYILYQRSFKKVLRSIDFHDQKKKVCFEKLITQSLPSRGFVWDHWEEDLPCSFLGPSSLYQRWNLHIREVLKLLPPPIPSKDCKSASAASPLPPDGLKKIIIMLIIRSETKNDWGSLRTSRLMKNQQSLLSSLKSFAQELSSSLQFPVEFVAQDFKDLPSYEDQIKRMSSVSILIGLHGAGITQSMLMPLGMQNCCGVIEIYPEGEFSRVQGHGNMIRKMGFYYYKMKLKKEDSLPDGALIPIDDLKSQLQIMVKQVREKSACVLPSVMENPYMSK